MFPSNYPSVGSSPTQYSGYPGVAQPQQRQKRSMSIGRIIFLVAAVGLTGFGGYLLISSLTNTMSDAAGLVNDPVGADADLKFGNSTDLKVEAGTKVTIRANGPNLTSVRPSGINRPVAEADTANVGSLGLAVTDPHGNAVQMGPATDAFVVDKQGEDSMGIAQFVASTDGKYRFALPDDFANQGVTHLSIVLGLDNADQMMEGLFGSGGGMSKMMVGSMMLVIGFIMLIFFMTTRFTRKLTGEIYDNLGGGFGGTGPGGPNIL